MTLGGISSGSAPSCSIRNTLAGANGLLNDHTVQFLYLTVGEESSVVIW